VANTLAYYNGELIMALKSFIIQIQLSILKSKIDSLSQKKIIFKNRIIISCPEAELPCNRDTSDVEEELKFCGQGYKSFSDRKARLHYALS
jgi:hypothetical protein